MSYDEFKKNVDLYSSNNAKNIEAVKKSKETPQNVLMMKTTSKLFEDGEKCVAKTMQNEFGFSEALVNKLMHFAYLQGTKAIDEKSFALGYEKARKEILDFMGVSQEND